MSAAAETKPPKPFLETSIVFKICQVKQPKQPKRQRPPPPEELPDTLTQCWPGICYWGSPPAMFWMHGDTTPYDGKPCYTLRDLTTDLAAGERMVKAIRTKQLHRPRTSPDDELLNLALDHVYAAVHQGHAPMEDWLEWILSVLAEPMAPLNTRGEPLKQHRGQGKATPINRAAFAAKQYSGLTRKDEQLLWLDFKKSQ